MVRWASGVTTMTHRPVGVPWSTRGRECHADGTQVMAEHVAEIVAVDLADVGGAPAEAGDPHIVFAADPPLISTAGRARRTAPRPARSR